jgi:hypothetical protein
VTLAQEVGETTRLAGRDRFRHSRDKVRISTGPRHGL